MKSSVEATPRTVVCEVTLFTAQTHAKLLKQDSTLGPKELFLSKCLDLGVDVSGAGALHDIGTVYAAEYGGCRCAREGSCARLTQFCF